MRFNIFKAKKRAVRVKIPVKHLGLKKIVKVDVR